MIWWWNQPKINEKWSAIAKCINKIREWIKSFKILSFEPIVSSRGIEFRRVAGFNSPSRIFTDSKKSVFSLIFVIFYQKFSKAISIGNKLISLRFRKNRKCEIRSTRRSDEWFLAWNTRVKMFPVLHLICDAKNWNLVLGA